MDQYQRHGTKLVFMDDAVEALAGIAMTHPSGARGLRQLISHALAPWDFQLSDLLTRGIREIHYDRLAILDGTKAHVVTGSPSTGVRTPTPITATTQRAGAVNDDDICVF